MKPDVNWPGDLQAVMDKALAREAGRRYRNASEYATELVQAIEPMPATSITTMGTQIVGRVSHGSAATVVTDVPKTRVASKDEANTPPAARPPASPAQTPTSSKMPMFAGLGVVVAALAGFAVWKSMQGSTKTNTNPVTPPLAVADSAKHDSVPAKTTPTVQLSNSIPNPRGTAEVDSVLKALSDQADEIGRAHV